MFFNCLKFRTGPKFAFYVFFLYNRNIYFINLYIMWNARVEFSENSYYHIFNTSFTHDPIFYWDEEYKKFYELLIKYLGEFQNIKLVSYCFLKNDFHLIVKNIENWYELSDFMRKLQVSYATWYRKRNPSEFKHPVFFWRFQATLLKDEEYLHKTISYVNYLPLKYKLVEDIKDYLYTSYHKIINSPSGAYLKEVITDFDELESQLKRKK